MTRTARKLSASSIYHVIMRGRNRQRILEDEEDRRKFLEVLAGYRDSCGFAILGYCLMDNHFHLLLKIGDEPLSTIMKKIACKFVFWYNAKYDRTGHLFQDRFKSEPVEDDAYLLAALRYIHRNPVKAGIVARPREYEMSSYSDYMRGSGLTDTDLVLSMLSREELERYTEEDADEECMDISEMGRPAFADEDARSVIFDVCGCSSVADFQGLDRTDRRKSIRRLSERGLSIRQISRLTGESIGVVRGCLKAAKHPSTQ